VSEAKPLRAGDVAGKRRRTRRLLEVRDRLGEGIAIIPDQTQDVAGRSRDGTDARVEIGTVSC
jgi:hypothetical protein